MGDQELVDKINDKMTKQKRLEELKQYMRKPVLQRKNKCRNKPCLCGSGKKFKYCCWDGYDKNNYNK